MTLAAPSLTSVYGRPLDLGGRPVVAVSQSGSSPDVVGYVEQARALGAATLAVTNDADSPLAHVAEHVLDLTAGPERSVAATKTYTASLLAIALIGVALDDEDSWTESGAALARVPEALRAAANDTQGVPKAVEALAPYDRAFCVGRGLNLCTAHETALKLTELTGTLVAPYSPADLLHGPVAAVGAQVPAVLIAPDEPASVSVLEVLPELRRRGAPVLLSAPPCRGPGLGHGGLHHPPRGGDPAGLAVPGEHRGRRAAARLGTGRGSRRRRGPPRRADQGDPDQLTGPGERAPALCETAPHDASGPDGRSGFGEEHGVGDPA